ncbi:MAG: hypothetical protein U5K43_08270 [Halofilum sp. (in: g-proteobacteria)]|nr:hypothetical protein [Halofilum sp. (in: g-proteobacteria)]
MTRFLGNRICVGLMGAALLLAAPGAYAADWGVGARAGTLGLGVDLSRSFTPFFNARVGVNAYEYGFDVDSDRIDYDGDIELDSYHALLDFHPFTGGFRLTGGIIRNNNQIVATGTATGGGQVDAKVEWDKNAPYAGIGWGNHTSGFVPLSFSIDLGVMAHGDADATVDSGGVPSPSRERDEEQDIEDDLSDYDLYPVVSAGLIFRF